MADAKISIASDTRAARQGIQQGIIEPLEDAVDALEDAGREGDQAGRKLEDAMRDAQKESRELGDEFAKTARDIASDSKQAAYRVKTDMGDASSTAKRDLRELKDEAVQNASETFSSFDGSVESFADGIQGTFGGIVSSMGPLGAAMGAAGALAIGVLMAELEKAEERQERLRERTSEYTEQLLEAGGVGKRTYADIADEVRSLATETDEAMLSVLDLGRAARGTGLDMGDLARAAAGDPDALRRMTQEIDEQIAGYNDLGSSALIGLANAGEGVQLLTAEQQEHHDQLARVRGQLREVEQATADAAERERLWLEAGGAELEAKAEAAEEYASSIQDALADAGESWEEYQDKETGALDLASYLENFEQRAAAIERYQQNMVTASSQMNQSALNYLRSLGADAAPLLQAYIDAPTEQQDRLESVWSRLGDAAGNSYNTELQNSIPDAVQGPDITARYRVDESGLNASINKPRTVYVGVQYIARNGVPVVT